MEVKCQRDGERHSEGPLFLNIMLSSIASIAMCGSLSGASYLSSDVVSKSEQLTTA